MFFFFSLRRENRTPRRRNQELSPLSWHLLALEWMGSVHSCEDIDTVPPRSLSSLLTTFVFLPLLFSLAFGVVLCLMLAMHTSAQVFAYAFPKPSEVERVEGMPWGCAAHAVGVLDGILKVFYGR